VAVAAEWVSRITAIAIEMVVLIWLGRWLDSKLGTTYWSPIGLVWAGPGVLAPDDHYRSGSAQEGLADVKANASPDPPTVTRPPRLWWRVRP